MGSWGNVARLTQNTLPLDLAWPLSLPSPASLASPSAQSDDPRLLSAPLDFDDIPSNAKPA